MPAGESAPPGALIDYYLAKDASGRRCAWRFSTRPARSCARIAAPSRCSIPIRARTWRPTTRSARRRRRRRTAVCPSTGRRRSSSSRRRRACTDSAGTSSSIRCHRRTSCRLATRKRPARCRAARIRITTCRGCRRAPTPCGSPADGVDRTQPIVVKLDPRVRITPLALSQLSSLSSGLYWEAVAAHRAFNEARALAKTLDARSGCGRRCHQGRAGSARADRCSAQRAAAAPARRRTGRADARSGEQRAAGGRDGDAGRGSGADRDAARRGDRGAGAGKAVAGAMGGVEGEGRGTAAVEDVGPASETTRARAMYYASAFPYSASRRLHAFSACGSL